MKTIYLAAGCFWGSQAFYKKMRGIISTNVGYANGNIDNPSYHDLKTGKATHAETVKIEYDEKKISLEKIISYYLEIIDPYSVNHQGGDYGLQYRTAVYYVDEESGKFVKDFLDREEKKLGRGKFAIQVEKLNQYFSAEDYHQDYLDKNPTGYCHVNLNLVRKEDLK